MTRFRSSFLVLSMAAALTACSSNDVAEASPTVRLLRGEISSDEYADAVTAANMETRRAEQFDVNRQPTRAYNTKSRRYEYVPEDTQQRWNEEDQRWEFTPVSED